MTFTEREQAADIYGVVRGLGARGVLGGDTEAITAERLEWLDRAERAIERAIGTERILLAEPDDAMLRQWLDVLRQRRAALQPATQ
jgi:hypothetical protein